METTFFTHETLLGYARLEVQDEAMGILYGIFRPEAGWSGAIQQAAREGRSLQPFQLSAQLENGLFLHPEGFIQILDLRHEIGDVPVEVTVAGVASEIITDFFLQTPPRPFVEAPWEPLDIRRKKGLEAELDKELGRGDSRLERLLAGHQTPHLLSDYQYLAQAADCRSDDVLFYGYAPALPPVWAVVHLSWRGRREREGYPHTTLYPTLDHFKYTQMYPDKAEWED
jgi:hypothetical protein